MNTAPFILKLKKLFCKKLVNDSVIPDNAIILNVRGFKYAFYKGNDMVVERFLKSFVRPWEMVVITGYNGEWIETIRMDELFNY